MVLSLIPSPEASPFLLTIPTVCYILDPGAAFISGLLLKCSMGAEREILEGKGHVWDTPQELPVPDSALAKELLSANLASPALPAHWALSAEGEVARDPCCQSIS